VTVREWLQAAQADARRRGLDEVAPLLEGLAASIEVLRSRVPPDDAAGPEPARDERPERPAPAGGTSPAPPPPPAGGLLDTAARIARGEITAERVVADCLDRIQSLQPTLNAFITVTADDALAAARTADRDIAAGRHRGPLHGIPVSLKDLIDQAGVATTAASQVRRHHVAAHDAPVTARLREAGAVFVGKTNLHEFAFGTTSEDSGFGPARHPLDPTRSPGGSSGGSAISVATGMALGTIGTDTGGSIRIPAAACGLVGLKPQWNEIPAEDVVPLSRQLDHVGPLARTVEDAWVLFEVLRGARVKAGARLNARSVGGLRIGVPHGHLWNRLDEDVEQRVAAAIEALARAGAHVENVALPHADETPHVYLPLVLADGAEYHAATLESRAADYTPNVRIRLEMGRYVMAEDYVRAVRRRGLLTLEVDAALARMDVLALPALAIPAPPLGASTVAVKQGSEAVRAVMLRCTQLFNLTGHPAMSLPCGRTRDGLPVGLQLVGARGGTIRLLEQALGVERILLAA
jgi:aspartyl-tRNA(Asn)/glutamyl-tRNA(Gln) amidotransferase subunit A